MDSALPIRGKICTVSHFIALDPHADPFFPSWFRLNQFAPWEALRSLYQLTMYIWRIIRNQSSWPSSPTARFRLSRVRMGSSSSRESLSDVMVSIRLSLITPIARYICSGSSLKFVLKVLSARRRSEFFSFFLLFFFFLFSIFLSGGNTDPHQIAVAGLAPNSGLLGGTPEDAALIDQWIHLAESEIDIFTNFIRGLCSGRFGYSKQVGYSSLF